MVSQQRGKKKSVSQSAVRGTKFLRERFNDNAKTKAKQQTPGREYRVDKL